MKRANRNKLYVIGLLASIVVMIPISNLKSISILPIDSYWRYQGHIISSTITSTGHLYSKKSSDIYLLRYVNDFWLEQSAPMIVSTVSMITGEDLNTIQFWPLFTPAWIIAQGILARNLTKSSVAFPIGVLGGVSFHMLNVQLLSSAHRVTLGWTLFFFLIFLLTRYNLRRFNRTALIFVVSPAFLMAYKTLTLASLVFFFTFFIVSTSFRENRREVLIVGIGVAVIASYSFISEWLLSAGGAIFLYSDSPYLLSDTNLGLSFIDSRSSTYIWLNRISKLTAVIAAGVAILSRFSRIWEGTTLKKVTPLDACLISFVVQGIFNGTVYILVPTSSGVHPFELGLYFTPILLSVAVFAVSNLLNTLDIYNRTETKNMILGIVVVIILTGPAFATTTMESNGPAMELQAQDKANIEMVKWSGNYSKGTISSDFPILSTFYTVHGWETTPSSYLPTTNIINESRQMYYTTPAKPRENYDTFLYDNRMSKHGILSLGSKLLIPSPQLDMKMNNSNDWGRVYSNGDASVFQRV